MDKLLRKVVRRCKCSAFLIPSKSFYAFFSGHFGEDKRLFEAFSAESSSKRAESLANWKTNATFVAQITNNRKIQL
jgi:hypothetical protein